MPRYGEYETVEEYHRSARVVLWRARRAGSADSAEYAVKAFRASEWGDAEGESSLQARFVEAAELQSRIAQRRSRHWAPVVARGTREDEAFWVSALYPRSVERLIEGRVNLTPADLQWIVLGALRGLSDLELELQRPHGNLKPTNLLLDDAAQLRGSPVLLTDPKPTAELDPAADRIADHHALGRIVVHLVRRRAADSRAVIGWPIEPGPEWKRLGRSGEGWRDLCNQLLQPDTAKSRPTFDELERLLVPLDRGARSRIYFVAAATTPFVLVAGGAVYLRVAPYDSLPEFSRGWAERLGNLPPDREQVPPEWALLCRAYYEWAGQFVSQLDDPARVAALNRNPYLRDEVVAPVMEVKARNETLDPRKFGAPGDLMALAAEPPGEAKKGTVVRRTVEAWRALDRAANAFAKWSERAQLARLADGFEANRWSEPATELRRASTAGASGTIAMNDIAEILRLAPAAARAETAAVDLEKKSVALQDADPVLRGLHALQIARVATAENTAALVRALIEAGHETDRFAATIRDSARIDYARFRQESFVATFVGQVTAEAVTRWETEIADFTLVAAGEDPRAAIDWTGMGGRLDQVMATYSEEEKTQPDPTGSGIRLRAEIASLKTRTTALLERRIVRKDRATAEREVSALREAYGRLENGAEAALAQIRPDASGWLAKARGTSFGEPASPLQRSWVARRDRVLAGADAGTLTRNAAGFRSLRERYRTLEAVFGVLNGERGVAALAPAAWDGVPAALQEPLAVAAASARAGALEELVALLPDGELPSGFSPETVVEHVRWTDARRRYAAALTEIAELGRGFAALDAALNRDAGDGASVAAALASLRGRAAYGAAASTPSVQMLEREVVELERLRGETAVDSLAAGVEGRRLSLALVAWRRLNTQPGWPAAVNAARMRALLEAWSARLTRDVPASAERSLLQAEITRDGVAWWRAAFQRARDDSSIGALLGVREAFGVSEASLSPLERFNLQLFGLKSVDWRQLAAADLVRRRDEAVARLRATLGAAADAETSAWLNTIAALQLAEIPGAISDVRQLGPGAVGWAGELAGDGRGVAFRKRWGAREQQLSFRLVESDSVVPFFLCTTEVSTGLLLDLLATPSVLTRMQEWLRAAAGEDGEQRLGAQVWRLDRVRGARLNERWTGVPLPSWPKVLYPDDIPAVAVPSRNHPLQYISPAAARFLATETLGCRLPTSEEWQAIAARAGKDRRAANLRDATWLREHNYLLAAGVIVDSPLLGDLFWPRSAGTPKTGRDAQAATAETDNLVWFSEVGAAPDPDGFSHVFGNVAEYLYDEGTRQFSVAGASALSAPEIEAEKPHPVEAAFATGGFSDVGFRLAFDAPGTLAERNRLRLLLRNKAYLRPAS